MCLLGFFKSFLSVFDGLLLLGEDVEFIHQFLLFLDDGLGVNGGSVGATLSLFIIDLVLSLPLFEGLLLESNLCLELLKLNNSLYKLLFSLNIFRYILLACFTDRSIISISFNIFFPLTKWHMSFA